MYNIGYEYTSFSFDKFVNNKPIPIRIEGYVITINGNPFLDSSIAQRLKLDLLKYQDILLKNGAYISKDGNCMFDDEDKIAAAAVALKLILEG